MDTPVNFQRRNTDPDAIRADIDYGLQIMRGFRIWSEGAGFQLAGKSLLEIGPGINLAGCLGLKALGASRVIAMDRWIAPWQDDYSPVFCRGMAEQLRIEEPMCDAGVFERVAAGGYASEIEMIQAPIEEGLRALADSVDGVFSNAVLEHMEDFDAAMASLARATSRGGVQFHQVDFRDHRDFDRPLEYLLATRDEHFETARAVNFEMGCQLRPFELEEKMRAAGFEIRWHPNMFVEPAYLDDFLPRLRASNSPYRNIEVEKLREISGLYVLRN